MRKLAISDLAAGGTGPVVSFLGAGPIDHGGFRVYPEPGFRTHDEPGRHTHAVPEVFCVFQGTGEIEIDGVRVAEFQAGDVIVMEPGEDHHLISHGKVPLVFAWMHMSTPGPAAPAGTPPDEESAR